MRSEVALSNTTSPLDLELEQQSDVQIQF